MAEYPPDLTVILTELAVAVNEHHPGTITDDEIDRVRSANNVLLVLSRVLTSAAKRAGVTQDRVHEIVSKARRAATPSGGDLFEAAPVGEPRAGSRITDWDVIRDVDEVLLKFRDGVPGWFIDDFWPGCLRRSAQGLRLTDRERNIAMHISSIARGER